MDKHRINYVCNRKPDNRNFPGTFEIGTRYAGRMYNDLYEISPTWGSDTPTKVITKKVFDQYFELINT